MKQAHVIRKNENIKFVVLNDYDLAIAKMEKLKKEEYEEHYKHIKNYSYDDYCRFFDWHISTVEYLSL
jgi:hypothetical protein